MAMSWTGPNHERRAGFEVQIASPAGSAVCDLFNSGDAIWTSNPARLSWFGPVHDIAIFRDDISGRLRPAFAVANARLTREVNNSGIGCRGTVEAAPAENADAQGTAEPAGDAIWTSNPARLSWFGPVHDIAIFRDDISGRHQLQRPHHQQHCLRAHPL
jgi:hypothetical protein